MRKIILLMLVVFTVSAVQFIALAGKKPNPGPPPPSCDPVSEKTAEIKLWFANCHYSDRSTNGSCSQIPNGLCDPAFFTGGTSLSSVADYGKWVMVVTVTGETHPNCPKYQKVYHPTAPQTDYSWDITVPSNIPYKISVDFYESVANCTSGISMGRPYFHWDSGAVPTSSGYFFVDMKYDDTYTP